MAKPLRILIIGAAWPMETFLERLLCGLAGNGFQLTLASEVRPDQTWLDETGIEWLSAPLWRGPGLLPFYRLFYHSLRILLSARREGEILWHAVAQKENWRLQLVNWYLVMPFAGKDWDVIYFPWNFAAVTYLPLFDLGIPVVLSCRGSQISVASHNSRRTGVLPGLRRTFDMASAVHCVSQDILAHAQILGLDPAKAYVIHPAVNKDFFSPAARSSCAYGVLRIITTGSLIWRKGLEYALLAICHLKDRGISVQLEILGDGPERNRVLFSILDLGLTDCVHLAGQLAPEQVRARLQQADVFLLSSLSEGISNAVLEAMACGLPVVTTDCGGMREAIHDGVEGFIVPVRSPTALAEKLALLANDPGLRLCMGHAGRGRVVRDFNLKDQIRLFHTLLLEAKGRA